MLKHIVILTIFSKISKCTYKNWVKIIKKKMHYFTKFTIPHTKPQIYELYSILRSERTTRHRLLQNVQ